MSDDVTLHRCHPRQLTILKPRCDTAALHCDLQVFLQRVDLGPYAVQFCMDRLHISAVIAASPPTQIAELLPQPRLQLEQIGIGETSADSCASALQRYQAGDHACDAHLLVTAILPAVGRTRRRIEQQN